MNKNNELSTKEIRNGLTIRAMVSLAPLLPTFGLIAVIAFVVFVLT